MKLKTVYVCQECEYQSGNWAGKCPSCAAWNSLVEDVVNVGKPAAKKSVSRPRTREKPRAIQQKGTSMPRIQTEMAELNQVLGGGIVQGSLILLSGEPGIGKSTLTLQIVNQVAKQLESVLYITGEESVDQVADRAKRLGCNQENINLLYATNLEQIIEIVHQEKPKFLVLDSIQVMASEEIAGSAGGLSQVRYVTENIMNTIKTLGIPTLLIGHVNKDGKIAGPKVLEHLVDAVLVLEGERDRELRMLRAVKNRYGSISEVGLFEMEASGLQEIKNPGERVLKDRPEKSIGSCLTMSMEGNRPLLMEVQALASPSHFGYPKRAASGFDRNRLELLIAVLQKHTKLNLAEQDIYINVVGGLSLRDPSADLAICMAISSSLKKTPIPKELVALGEVGLTGEVRPSFRAKERERSIKKMGLELYSIKRISDLT
jgi:DNA repair protein RadA/Sms